MFVVSPLCFIGHSLATPKPGKGVAFVIRHSPACVAHGDRTGVLQRAGSSRSSQYDWHLEHGDNFRK
jgi:hypothetical protein